MDNLGGDDIVGFWPQISTCQDQFGGGSMEQPGISEEAPSIALQNWKGEEGPSEFVPSNQQRHSDEPPSNPLQNPHVMPPPPPSHPPLNRARNMLFYKTRMCGKFMMGSCPYGNNCSFAHGPQELRRAPPNWQDIVSEEKRLDSRDWNERRTLNHDRKKFYEGEGHPYFEGRGTLRESSAISLVPTAVPELMIGGNRFGSENSVLASSGGDGNGSHQRVGFWKWKTCHKWDATGHCSFGATCNFAHGYAELKRFGSHMELGCTKVGADPSKTPSDHVNDDSAGNTDPSGKHQAQKKNFLKWKDPKKISRIYADWIDDIPDPTIHAHLTKPS